MKFVFRTDASLQIGTGHVMRCLTLADTLLKEGISSIFVSRAHAGHVFSTIRSRGHHLIILPDSARQTYGEHPKPPAHASWLEADWRADAASTRKVLEETDARCLVMDHYALDASWQAEALPQGVSLLVLDDLADRPHLANVLLDQNAGRLAADYAGLVPADCDLNIGPHHALLRPEFSRLRPVALARREAMSCPQSLLITMGGIDRENITGALLGALALAPAARALKLTVVMGDTAPYLGAIRAQAANMPIPTEVVAGVSDMAQRMMMADLCIGAVGSTAWERCALGLPTLQVILADNQVAAAQAMSLQGLALALPSPKAPEFAIELAGRLEQLFESSEYRAMAHAAAAITDGSGAARLARTTLQRLTHAH